VLEFHLEWRFKITTYYLSDYATTWLLMKFLVYIVYNASVSFIQKCFNRINCKFNYILIMSNIYDEPDYTSIMLFNQLFYTSTIKYSMIEGEWSIFKPVLHSGFFRKAYTCSVQDTEYLYIQYTYLDIHKNIYI
jgi:hypothetical protein